MRYIEVPEDAAVCDPVTGQQLKSTSGELRKISFRELVNTATAMAAQKGTADTLLLAEIRESVSRQSPGVTWEVSDEWYKTLADNTRRMVGWSAAEIFSTVPFVRAIQDAPNKRPSIPNKEP